jgi:hypothetical protein
MPRSIQVFLLLVLCAAVAGGADADLLPRHERWREFPAEVHGVVVDRTGRAWFELEGLPLVTDLKREVEKSADQAAPTIHGARILLFDSASRVWIRPSTSEVLLAYDLKNKTWIERQPDQSDITGHPPSPRSPEITGPATEDKSGRIFVADRAGCLVFDGAQWTYQAFYRLNSNTDQFQANAGDFGTASFARDGSGRVYAWTPWNNGTGTLGFWVHDDQG